MTRGYTAVDAATCHIAGCDGLCYDRGDVCNPQLKVVRPVSSNPLRSKIIDLLKEKKSATAVARELGISRNTVAGIKFRYNSKHKEKIGNVAEEMPKRVRRQKPSAPKLMTWRGLPKIKLPQNFEETGHVPRGAKKLERLKTGECRFAVTPHGVPPDKHRFCAEPTQYNSPYCPEHHKLCRETVNDRKGKIKSNPARGAVRLPARLSYHY